MVHKKSSRQWLLNISSKKSYMHFNLDWTSMNLIEKKSANSEEAWSKGWLQNKIKI